MSNTIKKAYNIFDSFTYFFKIILSDKYLEEEENIITFKKKMSSNGPLYIKFCQLISQRDDIFNCNDILKKHLIDLHENCPQHSYSETEKIFKENFPDTNLDDMFDYINPTPIASGSISQVYQVILKDKSEFSIMKIKHPNIDIKMKENISEFKIITKLFKKAKYNFLDTIDFEHFYECLLMQLDYENEVSVTQEVFTKTKNIDNLSCPEILSHTKDIIIETYDSGVSYEKFIMSHPELKIKSKIKALHQMFYMIFVLRISHIDCHNGNILYKLIDDQIHISFIDFGVNKRLEQDERDSIGNLLKSISHRNKNLFFKSLMRCCNNDSNLEMILDKLKDFNFEIFFSLKENSGSVTMIKDSLVSLHNQGIIINSNILDVMLNMSLIVESVDKNLEYPLFDYTVYDILENDKTSLQSMFSKIIDEKSYLLKRDNLRVIKTNNNLKNKFN